MEKTQLKRHDLIYLTATGKTSVLKQLEPDYDGEALELVRELFTGDVDVPGIVRRDDTQSGMIALGFVPWKRMDGRRLRLGAFIAANEISKAHTPYEILLENKAVERTPCMQAVAQVKKQADEYGLSIGVLGSAALEIVTGLPYTDAASDLDILLKPAAYDILHSFYITIQKEFTGINMDFELDCPNGYGVKLAEIFMNTQTVLGKSIKDVDLLAKADILKFLK